MYMKSICSRDFSFALSIYAIFILFYVITIQPCFASNRAAIGLGSTYDVSPAENATQIDVITHMLNTAGNTTYMGIGGTEYITYNFHGAGTNTQNITWAASGCNRDAAIVFHLGYGEKEF